MPEGASTSSINLLAIHRMVCRLLQRVDSLHGDLILSPETKKCVMKAQLIYNKFITQLRLSYSEDVGVSVPLMTMVHES